MALALLYSGGKDSSLAAFFLSRLGFNPVLVTATFDVNTGWRHARESARKLGFEHSVLRLDRDILEVAEKILRAEGFPRGAFNYIHLRALEAVAEDYDILSDGTRREDKTPFLSSKEIRSLEARFNVEYIPILQGVGHKTVNRMSRELFISEEGESSKINKGDYEGEFRTFLKNNGLDVEKTFPSHIQTRVISWRSDYVKSVESKED